MEDIASLSQNAIGQLRLTLSDDGPAVTVVVPRLTIPHDLVIRWNRGFKETVINNPQERPRLVGEPDYFTLHATIGKALGAGTSSVVFPLKNVTLPGLSSDVQLPSFVIKVGRPNRCASLARAAWFYERTQTLQGVALAWCYGWFETELTDDSEAYPWKEQNVPLLNPVLDRAYTSSERSNSVRPHKWLRARCYNPDIFSCLLLERLGERLPGGHKLSIEAKQDIEGMYKDICMAGVYLCEDLRWKNILTAPESPPGLPSLRSNHTQQPHKWRHIDMDMAASVPGTHAGRMFDGFLRMLRTDVYPKVERRILTDEQKYTPEFLEVLRRHREHGAMA